MSIPASDLTGRRRLYLLRHGHVDYFAPGLTDFTQVPLTEEGRRQAGLAAGALENVSFDAAFHSGLPRTRETLGIVLGSRDLKPQAVDELAEIRGGKVEVDTAEELAARLAFSFDGAEEEGASFLPGGELFADAEARIVRGYEQLVFGHAWKRAVVVAHEGVNRILLGHLTGGGLAALPHFEQDLCAINVLDFDVVPEGDMVRVERVILKAVNLTVHDPLKKDLPRTSLEHLFGIDFGGARPVGRRL